MPSGQFTTNGADLVGRRVDNGRLELISVLGFGAYGVVYRAVDVAAMRAGKLRQYAVKCMQKAGMDTRQRQFQRREIALHQLASAHKNVVTLRRTVEEGEYIFVVLDYCEDGDLFGMITDKQRYIGDDALIKHVFLQIIDAVQYCHSLSISHRDLKPENILCRDNGETVYLADFGLATPERISQDFGCGSVFYMSPECQGGIVERLHSYSTQANDVWSLGVILINLTCGRNPWRQAHPGDETFHAFLTQPDFLRTILPVSPELAYILRRIFTVDPRSRVTLSELRVLISEVDTFTMRPEELASAHAAATQTAASSSNASNYVSESVDAYYPSAADASFPQDVPSGSTGEDDFAGYDSEYEVEVERVAGDSTFSSPENTPGLDLDRSDSSGDGSSTLLHTPQSMPSDAQAIPIPNNCFQLSTAAKVSQLRVGGLRITNPSSLDSSSSGEGRFRL